MRVFRLVILPLIIAIPLRLGVSLALALYAITFEVSPLVVYPLYTIGRYGPFVCALIAVSNLARLLAERRDKNTHWFVPYPPPPPIPPPLPRTTTK